MARFNLKMTASHSRHRRSAIGEPTREFPIRTFNGDNDTAGDRQKFEKNLVGLEPEPRVRNPVRISEGLGREDGGAEPPDRDDEHDQDQPDGDEDQAEGEADGVVEGGQVEPVLEGVDVALGAIEFTERAVEQPRLE